MQRRFSDGAGDSPILRDTWRSTQRSTATPKRIQKTDLHQGLPRERLERILVLQNVNKLERRERVCNSVMKHSMQIPS